LKIGWLGDMNHKFRAKASPIAGGLLALLSGIDNLVQFSG
jgi:hypothetical protein